MSVTNPAIGMLTDEQKKRIEAWRNSLPKCGCGRIGRYETPSGLACNKYMRCDNAEFLAEQNKQLQARNAELEKEVVRLKEIEQETAEAIAKLCESLSDPTAECELFKAMNVENERIIKAIRRGAWKEFKK